MLRTQNIHSYGHAFTTPAVPGRDELKTEVHLNFKTALLFLSYPGILQEQRAIALDLSARRFL